MHGGVAKGRRVGDEGYGGEAVTKSRWIYKKPNGLMGIGLF